MGFLIVGATLCKKDGICVAECPARIIEFKNEGELPSLVPGGEELCIRCGHCVAVCPHAALALEFMRPEDCEPIRKELLPSAEGAQHLMKSRRSIRAYRDTAVPTNVVARLIDTARLAPTGHNTQPVHWTVFQKPQDVQRLAGLVVDWMRTLITAGDELARTLHMDRIVDAWERGVDRVCRGAPHLIVAHAEEGLRTSQSSCTIALTYVELAAYAARLGPCWCGYMNAAAQTYQPLQAELALPAGHKSFGVMMIGYPRFVYHRIPVRNQLQISWR